MAQPERRKVAVLGGGPAAIAAAFELTAPGLADRFEVTVYQPGWRLGGKCASGRNLTEGGRIEEHGLHVWFGFYDNAFRMARTAYEELDRPADHPLATFAQAFQGCDDLVLCDRQGSETQDFHVTFARNEMALGGEHELPDFWEIAARVCNWALRRWTALNLGAPPTSRGPARRGPAMARMLELANGLGLGLGFDSERGGEQLLHLARGIARGRQAAGIIGPWMRLRRTRVRPPGMHRVGRDAGARLLALLLTRFRNWLWEHVVRERCAQDPRLRLFFTTFDTFASAIAGIVKDGVLEHGWEVINDRDLCEWLGTHGAKEVTLGATPAERAPLLRAVYDLAFAYPGGDISAANAAAGTAINNLLRLLFAYRGSVLYKMRAGMGDTVMAPLYEVLRRRGVRFEFFSAVTDLHLSPDGRRLEAIEVVRQVDLSGAVYDPLVPVEGLGCWPSEPLWEQLRDGERRMHGGVDFELEPNPLGRAPRTLRFGEHFDSVVLAIPVGALPGICSEIMDRHERFARMVRSAETVSTQAFQLWLSKPTTDLGWVHGENSVAGTHVEPLDTWGDMSYLLASEAWRPEDGVRGLAYFCGALDDRPDEDRSRATARVKHNAQAFLEDHLGAVWPGALFPGPGGTVDWTLLTDRQEREGSARLSAQHWCANTTGSERYVLTTAKSMAMRLATDESGVENLMLAGDWTRNGIDGGCVEAAVTSGMQAARALLGYDRPIIGENPSWL